MDQGRLGIKRAKYIYVCPFSGIFDISPVYSNLLRLTALDGRLNANHSTQPCINYEWFTEIMVRISSAGTVGIAKDWRHVKVFQGILTAKGLLAQWGFLPHLLLMVIFLEKAGAPHRSRAPAVLSRVVSVTLLPAASPPPLSHKEARIPAVDPELLGWFTYME